MTKEQVIREYSSLSLAYVGDAVFELLVREYLLNSGLAVNGAMHRRAKEYVSAHAQNELLSIIADSLTDDESAVVRRGRNAKPHSHPKNADISEYHNATGFEALWGYLYLQKNDARIKELFNIILTYDK